MARFTIHSNGDTVNTLREQMLVVHAAARALEEALKEASPNMRNYYVNADGTADFKADVDDITTHIKAARGMLPWSMNGAIRAMEQGGK